MYLEVIKVYQKYNNGEISALQSFILIISIIIGTGVLGLSRTVAEVSGQDAWISVLINGTFISCIVIVIVYTISKFPKYNFLEYSSYLLSKPLGYLITFSYVLYAVLTTSVIIAYLGEMVSTWLLNETPNYIINLVIVLTVVHMTNDGITTLARFAQATVFLLIPLALLITVGLPEANFINLRPIGGSGINNIVKGIMPSFYAFAGYESMLVYYPYISNKQKPIMKSSVFAIIIVTLFYTATVMSQIAVYGADEIKTVLYPSINYLTSVNVPVVERSEIFFTIFWIFTVLATAGIQYLISGILLQNIFNTKKVNVFIYALSPVVYFSSLYPRNTAALVEFGTKVGKIHIFFGFVLPIMLFIMYLIKGKDYNSEKNN